jgi:hypothetical protein
MKNSKYVPLVICDNKGRKLTYFNVFSHNGKLLILDPGGAEDAEPIRSGFEDRDSWERRWCSCVTA